MNKKLVGVAEDTSALKAELDALRGERQIIVSAVGDSTKELEALTDRFQATKDERDALLAESNAIKDDIATSTERLKSMQSKKPRVSGELPTRKIPTTTLSTLDKLHRSTTTHLGTPAHVHIDCPSMDVGAFVVQAADVDAPSVGNSEPQHQMINAIVMDLRDMFTHVANEHERAATHDAVAIG